MLTETGWPVGMLKDKRQLLSPEVTCCSGEESNRCHSEYRLVLLFKNVSALYGIVCVHLIFQMSRRDEVTFPTSFRELMKPEL